MPTDRSLQREIEQEREELAEAFGVLREDLGDAARKAKRIPAALSGVVAVSVAVKAIRAALRRRR